MKDNEKQLNGTNKAKSKIKDEVIYKKLFNLIDEGFFLIEVIFDENNHPVDMLCLKSNAAALKMLGQDFTGKSLRKVYPNYEEYWYEIFGKVALTGESVRMEQYAKPDKKWYNFYIFKVGGPESGIIGSIFEDATERKTAEEELKISEEKFSKVFHANPGAIALLKPEGPILEVNDEFVNLTGFSRDEIIGRSSVDLNLVSQNFREKLYEKMQEKGSCHNLELEIQTKSGEKRTVLNTIENIKINGQKRIISIFFDITERKKVENELKEAHEHLEENVKERTEELEKVVMDLRLKEYLLDSANDSIFLHDLDGNFIYVNDVAYKSRGYTKDELLSMNIQDLSSPEFIEEIGPKIAELKKYGKSIFEAADLHKDGHIIPVEIHSRSINLDGKHFILSVVHDITEKKKAEKELKETIQNLERSNKELEQFAYVSSHDLQEPLRTIASFTQLLERRYKGKFDSDADEFMDFIVDAAIRMKEQIEGLLEYSRVETKGGEFKQVNTNEILRQTINRLNTFIKESDAEITYDELPVVVGDAEQLQRVFQNLISNAIKFRKCEEPLKIHISAYKSEDNNEYVFSIADNGIGIEEQYMERIFTIFQRLHTRDVYKGTGIGLSIVKRVIKRHGGHIWVESEFGVSSTFYFTLPVKQVEN